MNPTQIRVYADKIIISNDAALSEDWTAEKFMSKHKSVKYNPLIASVFFLAGFIESWGRGIEKMCNACRENENPLPEFEVSSDDVLAHITEGADYVESASAITMTTRENSEGCREKPPTMIQRRLPLTGGRRKTSRRRLCSPSCVAADGRRCFQRTSLCARFCRRREKREDHFCGTERRRDRFPRDLPGRVPVPVAW